MGLRLNVNLLTKVGKTRAQQAAALGTSEAALYRWIGGIGRNTGVNIPATTMRRISEILGATQEEAWKPAPLPPPRSTKVRDPRRSEAARHAVRVRWRRTTAQQAA